MIEANKHVVQLLLPLLDSSGRPFPDGVMARIREELVSRFGGITAFSRTPAEGVWSNRGRKVRDEVILIEVMVDQLDTVWWGAFRERLEKTLQQQCILLRAVAVTQL